MGKGAPLSFLNKKTWHPSNLRNVEEVWKREQKAEAEQRKLEELKKQLDEERKKQEFLDIAEAAGHGRTEQRLDWMYQGGMAAREDAQKRQEEHLLGKAATLDDKPGHTSRCEEVAALPSLYKAGTPQAQNETWQRLNNDPLLAIKRLEQEQLKSIRNNPVKMQEILKEVKKVKESSKKHKKDKKRKKHKDKRSPESTDSSEDDCPPPHPVSRSRSERESGGRQGKDENRGAGLGRDGLHDHQHHRRDYEIDVGGRDNWTGDRQEGRRDGGYERSRQIDCDRRWEEERDHRHAHEHRQRGDDRANHRYSNGGRGDDERQRENERRDRGEGREARPGDKRHRYEDDDDQPKGAARPRRPVDVGGGKPSAPRVPGYGLDTGCREIGVKENERAAETQRMLEEAARRKAQEEEEAASRRRQRRSQYQPGRLTEEDRARRLAEMQENAQVHEEQRLSRVVRAVEEDEKEARQQGAAVNYQKAATRDVFGRLEGGSVTLESRVTSRRHYVAREV